MDCRGNSHLNELGFFQFAVSISFKAYLYIYWLKDKIDFYFPSFFLAVTFDQNGFLNPPTLIIWQEHSMVEKTSSVYKELLNYIWEK